MDKPTSSRLAVILLIVFLALIAWGVAGFIDRRDAGWGAFTYSPDYVVNPVEPGGAADRAGLRAGDRMISVEGIPIEDLPLYSRWPRSLQANADETRRFVVEREGEILTIDVVYDARSPNMLHFGAALIGLAFMAFGLWALFAVGTAPARRLAWIGLAAGLATFGGGGPYLGTFDGLSTHVQAAAMMLFVILLLRFFLMFPEPTHMGRNPLVTGLIYAPWLLFIICLILELVLHPVLYHAFGDIAAILNLLYCLLALAALICSFILHRNAFGSSGLGLILIGLIVAIVPTAVDLVDWALIRSFDLPGSDYYALMLAAFPLFMALAVRRHAQAAQLT